MYTEKDAFEELDLADKFTVKHTKATPGMGTSYATVYQTETSVMFVFSLQQEVFPPSQTTDLS